MQLEQMWPHRCGLVESSRCALAVDLCLGACSAEDSSAAASSHQAGVIAGSVRLQGKQPRHPSIMRCTCMRTLVHACRLLMIMFIAQASP